MNTSLLSAEEQYVVTLTAQECLVVELWAVSVRSVEVSGRLGVDLRVRIEVESLEFQIVHHVCRRSAYPVRLKMEGCRRI